MDFYITSKSLRLVKEARIEDDFKLIIFDDVISCSKFTAAFLSPKISKFINSNASVDEYYIRFPSKTDFYSTTEELKNMIKQTNFIKQIQDFLEGQPIHINNVITSEIKMKSGTIINNDNSNDSVTTKLLIIFGQTLENNEMIDGALNFLGINEKYIKITPKNFFDLIEFARIKTYDQNNEELIQFIASNFFSLFNKENLENREKLKKLRNHELEKILRSPKLLIENEDSLFEIIYSLGSNFYNLFDYVEVQYLSIQNVVKLIQLIECNELSFHPLLWRSICRRLTYDYSKSSQIINPRQKQTFISCENGIFNYLKKSLNANPYLAKEVDIECSKKDCGKIECLFDNSKDTHFRLANRKDTFILFDFKNNKIKFSKYYFSVPSAKNTAYTGRPKTWRVEASNDKIKWDLIDLRQNDTSLNTWSCSNTFDCQNKSDHYYKYVRIKDVVSHNDTQEFLLSEIEFYGSLMEQ